MLELSYAFNLIIKSLESRMKEFEFALEYPEQVRPPEIPLMQEGKSQYIIYRGKKGRAKIEYSENKLALYLADNDDDCPDSDMTRASLTLLELDTYDERDLRYIFDEFGETLDNFFGAKKTQAGKFKLPAPVSKNAAKSGALSYDPLTLGNRFVGIYQEYKEDYRKNIEKYGEFLAEEFFMEHGNKAVIATIRGNDKIKVRKLFNLFNEIYDDATNETQSLIAVTILGELYKEPELFERVRENMNNNLAGTVEQVIKYLSSGKSKGARIRLKNPPAYKPPKKKKESPLKKMIGM